MQRFQILHRTYYNFTTAVQPGPHQLRLRPREGHELHIESFRLNITPAATLRWQRDVEDNSLAIANFDSSATQLMFESETIVQQHNDSPLEFLVEDYAVNYPFAYRSDERILLLPYMAFPEPTTKARLDAWINPLWTSGETIQTYTLLQRLTAHIHLSMSYRIREEPGVQTPLETLSQASGSCRDFATLFMEAARCLGLAARFVSGYLYTTPVADDSGATHAWAEVYLPGAGWKGFDPTTGTMAGTNHIAVAVARLPESVPPIAGSYTGSADSSLEVGVWLTPL